MTDTTEPPPDDLCEQLGNSIAFDAPELRRLCRQSLARIQAYTATIANLTDALHIQNKQVVKLAEDNAQLRGEVESRFAFIDNWFAPWGAWKTAWWETEVSHNAAFSPDNALRALANKMRQALAATETKP